jgi:hypothetical protein
VRVNGVEVFESSPWAGGSHRKRNAPYRHPEHRLLISGIEAFSSRGAVFSVSECQECYGAGRKRHCTRWHPNAPNLRHCIVRAKL